MRLVPEQVAVNMANDAFGDIKQNPTQWQKVYDAFLAGYIECLKNLNVGINDAARDSEPGRDDRKVLSMESARSRLR